VAELYDTIGADYRSRRRPDPRLASAIRRALESTETVVNVGAGAGSYEPEDRVVVAVEPAMTMIRQRRPGSAPVVQAVAADLPFRDDGFAGALAVLTVHHWSDWRRGLDELGRVTRRRVVVVTWDPAATGFWLTDDYFPGIVDLDRRLFPSMEDFHRVLGRVEVRTLPIPHDCIDGFLGAYWRRPHAYLDAGVRSAISTFAKLHDVGGDLEGLTRLRRDLENGTWARRHGHVLHRSEIDLGYRIVVARLDGTTSDM
jgi:SAM-dependent methyltransferase